MELNHRSPPDYWLVLKKHLRTILRKYLPFLAPVAAFCAVLFTLRTPRNQGAFDLVGFASFPTLVNGRVKPLDTVARTSLLLMQGRQRVVGPDDNNVSPAEWLLDMLYRPAKADLYQVFEIVHPEVLSLLSLAAHDGASGKRFSLHQFQGSMSEVNRQAMRADGVEASRRTRFERAIVQLRDAVALYQRLQSSLIAPGSVDFLDRLALLKTALPQIAPAVPNDATRALPAAATPDLPLELGSSFSVMESLGYLRPIPPSAVAPHHTGWKTAGAAWAESLGTGKVAPAALSYAAIGRGWLAGQSTAFNQEVQSLQRELEVGLPTGVTRRAVEMRLNAAQPFYTSALIYLAAFIFAVLSWLKWPDGLGRGACGLVVVAFLLATAGIATRMWLEGRPPVTNLYSSALFVGWGAVALCLILEYFFRNAIGSAAAGLIGFATLLIAHHLALGGDTLEMMRAVLDSNLWLATHVVIITVGYSATFVAGVLGIVYVLRGRFTRSLDPSTASALGRMIYGIVCFATLFSLVGTVLGGIWADQSWGRFWGWDPKENGALLIVIWNAMILHARWGGVVRDRGVAMMAVFGNVVTAWSWFGVNMLGVGLHSYGFMDATFWWLLAFAASQLAIVAVVSPPLGYWRSASRTQAIEG